MEADWSVEIGADLPRIVVPWSAEEPEADAEPLYDVADGSDVPWTAAGVAGSGMETIAFVDLRDHPEAVWSLAEVRQYPGLRGALTALNGPGSPVFTTKCDVFPLGKEEIDPYEFDAGTDCDVGMITYVDVVLRDAAIFSSLPAHEAWLRGVVDRLRQAGRIRGARADLVLREANVFSADGYGVTVYVAGCGGSSSSAAQTWQAVLDVVLKALGVA